MKTLAPVRRGHGHQDDLVAHRQLTHPVNHTRTLHVEALTGLLHHGLDGAFGHAGVMLQGHLGKALPPADRADKTAHRAHARLVCAQRGQLIRDIKVLGLNAD